MNAEKRSRRSLEPDLLGPPPKIKVRRRRRRSPFFRYVIQPALELGEAIRQLLRGPGASEEEATWGGWTEAHPRRSKDDKAPHRRKRSLLVRYLIAPPLELADSLGTLCKGSLLPLLLAGVAIVGWWFWPWISSLAGLPGARRAGSQEVISTFVEDPQRTIAALRRWQDRPGSLLILQGRPTSQEENRLFVESQGLWPTDQRGIVTLTPGCDTVGQINALGRLLRQRRNPGQLTLVTSPAHMGRTLAIAQILVGSQGWSIQGLPVVTGDNRPENIWRTFRDQARAQLIRTFDWDPVAEAICRAREDHQGG